MLGIIGSVKYNASIIEGITSIIGAIFQLYTTHMESRADLFEILNNEELNTEYARILQQTIQWMV